MKRIVSKLKSVAPVLVLQAMCISLLASTFNEANYSNEDAGSNTSNCPENCTYSLASGTRCPVGQHPCIEVRTVTAYPGNCVKKKKFFYLLGLRAVVFGANEVWAGDAKAVSRRAI
jgi:hypothetical protein